MLISDGFNIFLFENVLLKRNEFPFTTFGFVNNISRKFLKYLNEDKLIYYITDISFYRQYVIVDFLSPLYISIFVGQ